MTRTNKKRKNPPGSLPDDAAKGPGVKDNGPGEDSEVEVTQVSVEAKTSADASSACVLLQGESGQTTGIVLQTKAQREIFSP
ncbi:hypothetical protein PI124_g16543 [Phytophthora idaei]|nr:hypothetical protein PI124_g16543 [Phytophthora idaei]